MVIFYFVNFLNRLIYLFNFKIISLNSDSNNNGNINSNVVFYYSDCCVFILYCLINWNFIENNFIN